MTTALNDGIENSDIITFEITVGNVNERPEIVSVTPVSDLEVDDIESGVVVNLADIVTADADGDTVTLRLADGGPDNDLFEIVNNEIQFIEAPELSGGEERTYNVSIVANDGQLDSIPEDVAISVMNINNAPEITNVATVPTQVLSQIDAGAIVADLSDQNVIATEDIDLSLIHI